MARRTVAVAANNELHWRLIEEVVALLEQSLDPSARVEHNVELPELGTDLLRQCDVVIRSGVLPRETLTIVEVQDRTRKPDINTFHGWCEKMTLLGAHRLICVSARGYPASIIQDVALRRGPKVLLLTLQELQNGRVSGHDIALPYIFQKTPRVQVVDVSNIWLKREPGTEGLPDEGEFPIDIRTTMFLTSNSTEPLSLIDLGRDYLDNIMTKFFLEQRVATPLSYTAEVDFGATGQDLRLQFGEFQIPVGKLLVKMQVSTEIIRVPVTLLEYRQENIANALRWVALARGQVGEIETDVRIAFDVDDQGTFRIQRIFQQGIQALEVNYSPDPEFMETYLRLSETTAAQARGAPLPDEPRAFPPPTATG
jgi:hypothetical protein